MGRTYPGTAEGLPERIAVVFITPEKTFEQVTFNAGAGAIRIADPGGEPLQLYCHRLVPDDSAAGLRIVEDPTATAGGYPARFGVVYNPARHEHWETRVGRHTFFDPDASVGGPDGQAIWYGSRRFWALAYTSQEPLGGPARPRQPAHRRHPRRVR